MNKKLLMILPMLATLVATQVTLPDFPHVSEEAGPAPVEFSDKVKGEYIGKRQAAEGDVRPDELTIHYQSDNPTMDYSKMRFYFWTESIDGAEFKGEYKDEWMSITVKPKEFGAHNKFMFIIKETGTWAGQSTNTEIPYDKFPAGPDGKLEVWAVDGEGKNIEVYATKAETEGGKIKTAKFASDWKTIDVEGTHKITNWELYAYTSEFYGYSADFRDKNKEFYKVGEGTNAANTLKIKLPYYAPSNLVYLVKTKFETGKTKQRLVGMENLYETERFETYYDTIGKNHDYSKNDLGVTYTPTKSTFKLWAPMCARVSLRIYEKGTPQYLNALLGNDLYDEYLMNFNKDGVWTAEIEGDLNGKYYTYYVSNFAGENEVCDPYATATGINGIRAMVLDFSKTNPEGWDKIPTKWDGDETYDIKSPTELAVYETHVRDLTMDKSWQSAADPKTPRGTFDAFAEKGTTYTENGVTVKTGHDHIEELGFNAVQILPFFDSDNSEVSIEYGDEETDSNYNWGYNPLNYNVVEGMYSTNPHDGSLRVKELKKLVQSYATDANKTRIIMDVVYNHVGSVSTIHFNKIMPKYYFRMLEGGIYADGAGCGNEVKSEAPMMRKFIVDSVQWWASEYKIKGFRFDLMKIIDRDTMRLVKDYLYRIDPDMVCWGEGWALGYAGPEDLYTDSGAVFSDLGRSETSPGHLAAFSDSFRNAIKGGNDGGWGSTDKKPGYGFISQGPEHVGDKPTQVTDGMLGIFNGAGSNPEQTVNYASCHDNYTLYDQLFYTMGNFGEKPAFDDVAKALLGVQSAVTYSSGISFYNGGEELFRSKVEVDTELKEGEIQYFEYIYGTPISHNSYASSDAVNAYRYDQKIAIDYDGDPSNGKEVSTTEYFKKYCEMIKGRKEFNGRLNEGDNIPNQDNASADVRCEAKSRIVNENSYRCSVLKVYIKNGADEYWLFFGGRTGSEFAGHILFEEFGRAHCVYNSQGDASAEFGYGPDHRIAIKQSQFAMFKNN